MSNKLMISMVEATLPPGFRFHPRDEELISDYLSNKVSNSNSNHRLPLLLQVDLNHCEPWDLPETACVGGKEWYFYSQRDRKYATGLRTNRATVSGYWKATGKDRCILGKRTQQIVGMRKTLVFYLGRAPKGKKTDWVMHEFRLQPSSNDHHSNSPKEDWVLCRVFCKNRELISGKQEQIDKYCSSKVNDEDTLSCSSSLPPLMDPNYSFSFDQSQPTIHIFNHQQQQQQQVPCFSINKPPGNIDIIFSNNNSTIIPPANPNNITIPSSSLQSLDHYSSSCCENSSKKKEEEEEEVFKAILSRFNEMDHESSTASLSFDHGISDQSFLSDAALPVTMWYP